MIIATLFLASACTGISPAETIQITQTEGDFAGAPATEREAFAGNQTVAQDGLFYAQEEQAQATAGEGRVILKTATLSLTVEDASASLAAVAAMAEEMGGWVVSSNTSMMTTPAGQEVARGTITVRVPAVRLDEALTQIKSGGGEVDSETVTGEDVTAQYVDLSSRLTNLEAAEEQLRTILDEARRTEDVMSVFNQLVTVRGDIEVIRGQLRYYDQAAAFSSITVSLTPKAITDPVQIAGWSPLRTAEDALATLINLLQGIADFIISAVIIVGPLLLVVGLPVWWLRRRARRA
jgi:hypothetical protein